MSRLEKLLKDWVVNDLISKDQANNIKTHESSKTSHSFILYGFLILGAVVIGIGIISLIAANWVDLTDFFKLSADFILLVALAAGAYRAWEKQRPILFEVLLVSFMLHCLASIGLISQIYHIGGKLYQALLLWSFILLTGDTEGLPFMEFWGQLTWVYKLVLFASAVAFPFFLVRGIATTVHLASESHLGHKIGMWESYSRVRRKTLGVVWLLVIPYFLGPAMPIGAMIMTFSVGPGIPVAILEDQKLAAIGRGWALSKGKKNRLYLLWILSWILLPITLAAYVVPVSLVEAVVPYHPVRNAVLIFGGAVLAFIVGQLWIIALTLHYHDCTADRANSTPTVATS